MPELATVAAMPPATLGQRMGALAPAQRMRLAVGLALLVAIVIAGIVFSRQSDWRVLYNGLSDKDGGAIVAQLTTMNVPYKYSEGGGAIMVPSERVYDTRLRLASLGLPKGSVSGFELMESNRFGMTQFQERLSFQRGLEGELTRSIQALSSVQSARVHLALPNQNGFFREQQKPSASVLVSLYPGATLDRAQLAGIVHLVAASVPELSPAAVSVLDDSGKLLSTPTDGSDPAGSVDAQQLQYAQQLEQTYRRRILEILEPVVGRNNVKAQVSAEIDFSQTESTSESHRPNQTPDATAIRSQQLIESNNGGSGAPPSGIPGATTNQPPGTASAPVNAPAQALTAAGGSGAASSAAGGGSKRESIINYEVDKTVRVVRGGSGAIKRLSAAVVINDQSVTDDRGRVTSTPLPAAQLEKMTALVRETIGFNRERGDSVNVVNAAFVAEKQTPVDVPVWKDPQMQDLARSLAWPVGLVLLAIIVLLGVVRPAVKALTSNNARQQAEADEQAAEGGLDAVVADDPDRPSLLTPATPVVALPASQQQLRLEEARRLTHENPVAVANIVKGWMGSEPAGT